MWLNTMPDRSTIMSSQPSREYSPVPRTRPLLFINYNHPSDRHLSSNRKSVSSFLSSTYRRPYYKTIGTTKPVPLGFQKQSQQADSADEKAAHTEAEVKDEYPVLDPGKLTDVSGGFQMDPFDALPVKGARAVSLAMRYCECLLEAREDCKACQRATNGAD